MAQMIMCNQIMVQFASLKKRSRLDSAALSANHDNRRGRQNLSYFSGR